MAHAVLQNARHLPPNYGHCGFEDEAEPATPLSACLFQDRQQRRLILGVFRRQHRQTPCGVWSEHASRQVHTKRETARHGCLRAMLSAAWLDNARHTSRPHNALGQVHTACDAVHRAMLVGVVAGALRVEFWSTSPVLHVQSEI